MVKIAGRDDLPTFAFQKNLLNLKYQYQLFLQYCICYFLLEKHEKTLHYAEHIWLWEELVSQNEIKRAPY